ncbi:MAG: hypothetical protein IOC35_10970 [Methylobacterium sp.]|nr:hypothetical protein [Methylobacterium sp.]
MSHYIRYPGFNLALEPGYQLKAMGLSASGRNANPRYQLTLTLNDWGAPEQKYRPDQPRVPRGSPLGGQWTSGALSADPFNIELLLDQYGSLASQDGLLFDVAAADIPRLADAVMEWLGPGAFQRNSPNGAIQFFSADMSRHIRFDITTSKSHGLRPHINVYPPIGGRDHLWLR